MHKDPLLEGRAAFAKTIFNHWIFNHRRIVLAGLATLLLTATLLFQLSPQLLRSHSRAPVLYSDYYKRYTINTNLITKQHYEQALQEAKQFKHDLSEDALFWQTRDKMIKSGTMLYAYNLIRIAALERALGSVEGELSAWNELIAHAGWEGDPKNPHTYDPDAYSLITQHFHQGSVSLQQFVLERKKLLEQSASNP
jgi:hypothetical protein